jgi:hypothetical protein
MPIESKLGVTALVGLSTALLACPVGYYQNQERDVDRTPTVDTGAGATIIYPGQPAPALPGNSRPAEPGYGGRPGGPTSQSGTPGSPQPPYGAAQAAQPPPEYGQPYESGAHSTSGAPSGGGVTMIGGSEVDEKTHRKVHSQPVVWKYIALPFAIAAAPFKYAVDKVRGEHEPGPSLPQASPAERQPPPGPPPVDYETAALRNMERELAQREALAPPPQAQPPPFPSSTTSIADELAALRARAEAGDAQVVRHSSPAPHGAEPSSAEAPRRHAMVSPSAAASGIVDRNGDGHTDHWIFRANGEIEREELDENFDGRPDRILHYDLSSHQVVSLDEDTDQDGNLDSWTVLRGGVVVRRRADSDADGYVDSWSFYRDGKITRLERDSSGNGFRDHVAYYRDGRIDREESDGDNDGRPDLVKYYDANEKVFRVEEDTDGSGRMDVISHYEGGRLLRRELLDASILGTGEPGGVEHN